MAVLNNIRKESIINTIIASLSEKNVGKIELVVPLQKKETHITWVSFLSIK